MPRRYYDYYEETPEGEAFGAFGKGLSSGFTSGIERALNRKDKMKDVDTELGLKGYTKVKPGETYDPDTPKIELFDNTYIKRFTPTELAEREYTKRERETELEYKRAQTDALRQKPKIAEETLDIRRAGEERKQSAYESKQQEDTKRKELASEMVRDSALDTLKTINVVKKGVNNFGVLGGVAPWGTERYTWKKNLDKLLSGRILDTMNAMKQASRTGATGFGQLSEKELKVLQDASTALKVNMRPEDALLILNDMEAKLNQIAWGSNEGGQAMPQGGGMPVNEGISEEDIAYTLQMHPEYTREQIIQMLQGR